MASNTTVMNTGKAVHEFVTLFLSSAVVLSIPIDCHVEKHHSFHKSRLVLQGWHTPLLSKYAFPDD